MAQKIDIREDMHNCSIKRKEQKKIWYDKRVKMQYFNYGNFVLFRDSTPHLGKLAER